VVIRDELTGAPGHEVQAAFQFAPGSVVVNDSWALYDDRYELAWFCSAPVRARVERGGERPSSGWIALSLGVRQPAPRLQLEFAMRQERVVLLTVVADRSRAAGRARRVSAGEDAGDKTLLRACVAVDGFSDDILSAIEGAATTSDIETDASLVVVRRTGGRVVEVAQAGGTRVQLRTATDSPTPASRLAGAVG
jgi:hypothetical protein